MRKDAITSPADLAGLTDAYSAATRFGRHRVQRDARGWSPVTTSDAEARHRLEMLRREQNDDRRRRLEGLLRERPAPPARPAAGIGWRRDPQGRLRIIDWTVGEVVVPSGRPGRDPQ
jgi:hypothetical protein